MKLNAKLDFERDEIEDIVTDKINREGYVLSGEINWEEDGSVHVEVRPMTPGEKEEQGLDPRSPVEVLSDRVHERLEKHEEFLDQYLTAVTQGITSDTSESKSSEPPQNDSRELTVVTGEDYDLEDGEVTDRELEELDLDIPEDEEVDEDYVTSRKRIQRIREEQAEEKRLYGDVHRDEEGYVVLGNN